MFSSLPMTRLVKEFDYSMNKYYKQMKVMDLLLTKQ